MTETPILDQRAVEEIEAEFRNQFILSHPGLMLKLSALCATVKHLRAQLERGALCEECEQWEYNEDGSCRTFMICGACWNNQQSQLKPLRAENEELRAGLNDPCLVAGYHVCGGVHKAGDPWKDFRTRAIELCNDKAAGYRQGAEGNLARETWIDRAEVVENLATELEKL